MRKVTFPARAGFRRQLNTRVDHYFKANNLGKTGDWRMFVKTAIILTMVVGLYTVLVFFPHTLLTAALTAFLLAQAFVLVGFNVMHDGGHGSYSPNRVVNRLTGWMADFLGGSQMLWSQKHNILHHTYTNIDGLDDDINTFGLIRMSPNQTRYPWHRFQHLYALPVYSLLTLTWVTYSDYQKFFSGKIGDYRLKKPSAVEMTVFFGAKIFYYGYMLAIPLFFHPVLHVLVVFLGMHLIMGLTFSVVFQLAHVVEGNEFPAPDLETGVVDNEWAIHQVETTANFGPTNWFATWYLGGLNFQIEHHLFPKICHVHYPTLSRIVRNTCEEFQVRYISYPSVRAALVVHYRFLRELGRREDVPLEPGAALGSA